MRIASKRISIIVIVLTFLACKADSEYSRNYACHFIFYTQHGHVTQNKETSILNGILDSPGVFAKVSVKKLSGITHVIVVPNNGGKNEDIKLTTEVENNQITYSMGANNALLIGCDTNLQKVAFDGQCANCLENYSTSNFPLAWSDNDELLHALNVDVFTTLMPMVFVLKVTKDVLYISIVHLWQQDMMVLLH